MSKIPNPQLVNGKDGRFGPTSREEKRSWRRLESGGMGVGESRLILQYATILKKI